MIPSEVAAIASLIFPQWTETDDLALNEVLEAAWRIYNAGYHEKTSEVRTTVRTTGGRCEG